MKSEASEHDRLPSRVSTQAGKYLRCWCQAGKAEIPVATPWISLFQSNHWISHWSCSPTAALDLIDICLVDPLCHSSLWTVCGILSQQGIEGAIGPSTLLLSGRQYKCTNDVRVEARATPVSLYTYIDVCVCARSISSIFYHYVLVSSRCQLERCLVIAVSNVQIMQPLRPF
jgi:hypothetical protein